MMSDTDSEDEPVEEDEPIYPSIAMCRNLFEKDEEAIEEVEDDQNKDEAADKDEATDGNEETTKTDEITDIQSPPELLPLQKSLARELKCGQLHEERQKDRLKRTNNFSVALSQVNDVINYPRYKFDHIEMSI